MASVNRERTEALVREANASRNVWLLAREEHRMEQLAANVEVRRVWIESEPTCAMQSRLERFANSAVEPELTYF